MAESLPVLNEWIEVRVGACYADKYGRVGACVERRGNDFGHRWGRLDYGDGTWAWHRTSSLAEVEAQPSS